MAEAAWKAHGTYVNWHAANSIRMLDSKPRRCPVSCIPINPDRVETREQLQAKFEALQVEAVEIAARA